MPRRGEYIFKRKDGRWEARYIKEVKDDHKKIYGSVYAKTYKEVKIKREQICQELKVKTTASPFCEETFGYYALRWLEFYKITFKISTYSKYHYSLHNYILPYLGRLPIYQITTQTLDAFTKHLMSQGGHQGSSLSVKTVRDLLSILNSIILFLRKEYDICLNVYVIYPKMPKKECRILNKQEFIKLNYTLLHNMDACKLGVLIAMSTGIRIGELCALKWKHIDLERNYIIIEKTMQRIRVTDESSARKTKIIEDTPKSSASMRKIPLSKGLVELCIKFQKSNDCYVLTGRSDYFIEPRTLERRFSKYSKEAGIQDAHFHMLRHTFASMCIDSGFELKSLSEILGHSGPKITLERYVHTSFEKKRDYMDTFIDEHICCQ